MVVHLWFDLCTIRTSLETPKSNDVKTNKSTSVEANLANLILFAKIFEYRKVFRGLDHICLHSATFREILLSSLGKVNGVRFTIIDCTWDKLSQYLLIEVLC